MSHRPALGLALVLLALPLALRAAPCTAAADEPGRIRLTVRATEVVAPCARAAVAAYAGYAWTSDAARAAVSLEPGPLSQGGDVLVGTGVEVTRALESGIAVVGTDVALAHIPWVLTLAPGVVGPDRPAGEPGSSGGAIAVLARADVEVVLVGGSAAHEARRHLDRLAPGRVREAGSADPTSGGLVAAPVSLAGPGERVALDVPPLEAQAALGAPPGARSAAARDLLAFLASAKGTAVFAECRAAP
jgi:hypothetical protein